jgi:negative regulator of sigma-B (phosphoserine phosphatase)
MIEVAVRTGAVEWVTRCSTLPGQTESGDRHVFVQLPMGALVAALDGSGHGGEAAYAAARGASLVEAFTPGEPLPATIRRCHDQMRETRGAAMALALMDTQARSVTWIAVGNIEGVLLRAKPGLGRPARKVERLLMRAGVVGRQLPQLQTTTVPVEPGDTLILATDGIDPSFADALDGSRATAQIVDGIMAKHCKQTDDALVLAARYLG